MLGAVVVLGGGAAAYVNIERSKKEKEAQCRRDQAVGRPDIGGPFKLTGLDGAYNNVGRTLHEPPPNASLLGNAWQIGCIRET